MAAFVWACRDEKLVQRSVSRSTLQLVQTYRHELERLIVLDFENVRVLLLLFVVLDSKGQHLCKTNIVVKAFTLEVCVNSPFEASFDFVSHNLNPGATTGSSFSATTA